MRWILSLKKPMKYREFATALAVNLPKSVGKPTTTKNSGCKSAKECGNTNNNKKPVCRDFDFDPKKSVRKTKEIPRIRHRSACKFMAKKVRKNPKIKRLITFFPQILLFWPVGRPKVVSVCGAVDSDPRAVR